MGLSHQSTDQHSTNDSTLATPLSNEHIIAIAGNPNVGKSTVFNGLTGMRQHTGNSYYGEV